jgi:hypothetical protein
MVNQNDFFFFLEFLKVKFTGLCAVARLRSIAEQLLLVKGCLTCGRLRPVNYAVSLVVTPKQRMNALGRTPTEEDSLFGAHPDLSMTDADAVSLVIGKFP